MTDHSHKQLEQATMPTIQPILTAEDHLAALERLDAIFYAQEGSAEFDEAAALVELIQAYEEKQILVDEPPTDPHI